MAETSIYGEFTETLLELKRGWSLKSSPGTKRRFGREGTSALSI